MFKTTTPTPEKCDQVPLEPTIPAQCGDCHHFSDAFGLLNAVLPGLAAADSGLSGLPDAGTIA